MVFLSSSATPFNMGKNKMIATLIVAPGGDMINRLGKFNTKCPGHELILANQMQ
jgi:hypothetical protein